MRSGEAMNRRKRFARAGSLEMIDRHSVNTLHGFSSTDASEPAGRPKRGSGASSTIDSYSWTCLTGHINRVCFHGPDAHDRKVWDEKSASRLGVTLRHLRNARGLSQESLAYQAGITKNQLQLIEAGRASGRKEDGGPSNPRMATLSGLARVLGVSVAELFADAEL